MRSYVSDGTTAVTSAKHQRLLRLAPLGSLLHHPPHSAAVAWLPKPHAPLTAVRAVIPHRFDCSRPPTCPRSDGGGHRTSDWSEVRPVGDLGPSIERPWEPRLAPHLPVSGVATRRRTSLAHQTTATFRCRTNGDRLRSGKLRWRSGRGPFAGCRFLLFVTPRRISRRAFSQRVGLLVPPPGRAILDRLSRVRHPSLPGCRPPGLNFRVPDVHQSKEWRPQRNHWPWSFRSPRSLSRSLPRPSRYCSTARRLPPMTPLNAVPVGPTSFRYISASDLTSRIRAALRLHPDPAYTSSDVSVRSTRTGGGATALLCAGIDGDRIRLIGRWRSDEMYRYLHVQAAPVMTGLSAAMLCGGSFRLTPGQFRSHPPSAPTLSALTQWTLQYGRHCLGPRYGSGLAGNGNLVRCLNPPTTYYHITSFPVSDGDQKVDQLLRRERLRIPPSAAGKTDGRSAADSGDQAHIPSHPESAVRHYGYLRITKFGILKREHQHLHPLIVG